MNKRACRNCCSRAVLTVIFICAGASCDRQRGGGEIQRLKAERVAMQGLMDAAAGESAGLTADVQRLTEEGAGNERALKKLQEQEKRAADLNARLNKVSEGLRQETESLIAQHQAWRGKVVKR